jgi:hypothetical protein
LKKMTDEPAYYLEIGGLNEPADAAQPQTDARGLFGRPWLGVHFECCGVYARVYRESDGSAYVGRCPRCTRTVRFRVGPGGTADRFFSAR